MLIININNNINNIINDNNNIIIKFNNNNNIIIIIIVIIIMLKYLKLIEEFILGSCKDLHVDCANLASHEQNSTLISKCILLSIN